MKVEKISQSLKVLIPLLEDYRHLDTIAIHLFKIYSKELYDVNNRVKLFDLANDVDAIENDKPYLYHYYWYISHAYLKHWRPAEESISIIRSKFRNKINPNLREVWRDESGEVERFEARIHVTRSGYKMASIPYLQQKFPFRLNQKKASKISKK